MFKPSNNIEAPEQPEELDQEAAAGQPSTETENANSQSSDDKRQHLSGVKKGDLSVASKSDPLVVAGAVAAKLRKGETVRCRHYYYFHVVVIIVPSMYIAYSFIQIFAQKYFAETCYVNHICEQYLSVSRLSNLCVFAAQECSLLGLVPLL